MKVIVVSRELEIIIETSYTGIPSHFPLRSRINAGTPLHNMLAKLAASHTLWNFWHQRLWRLTRSRGIAIIIMHHPLPITHRKRMILRDLQILHHPGARNNLPAHHGSTTNRGPTPHTRKGAAVYGRGGACPRPVTSPLAPALQTKPNPPSVRVYGACPRPEPLLALAANPQFLPPP